MGILVLGIDPGAARTGYAWKLRESTAVWPTLHKGIVQISDLEKWLLDWDTILEKWPHDKFVVTCEKFIQRRTDTGNGRWIKQGTAEIYGACWYATIARGGRFVPARPDNLATGCRLAGIKWSGNSHLRDDHSAEAHAAYLCANGLPKNPGHPIG